MKQLAYLLLFFVVCPSIVLAQSADWKQKSVAKLEEYVKEQIAYETNDIVKVISYEKIDGYDLDANLVYVVEFKGKVKANMDYYKRPEKNDKIINITTEKPQEAIKLKFGIQGGNSTTSEVRPAENLPLYYEQEETEFSGKATIRKSDNGSRIEKIEIIRFGKPKGTMPTERVEKLRKEQEEREKSEKSEKEKIEKEIEAKRKRLQEDMVYAFTGEWLDEDGSGAASIAQDGTVKIKSLTKGFTAIGKWRVENKKFILSLKQFPLKDKVLEYDIISIEWEKITLKNTKGKTEAILRQDL